MHLVSLFKIKFLLFIHCCSPQAVTAYCAMWPLEGFCLFSLHSFLIITKRMEFCCWFIVKTHYFFHSLPSFSLSVSLPHLLCPSAGDVPHSCPETAALHHSQCKSKYARLCLPLTLYLSSVPLQQIRKNGRQRKNICCLCLLSLIIFYCTYFGTHVPPFHALLCAKSELLFPLLFPHLTYAF